MPCGLDAKDHLCEQLIAAQDIGMFPQANVLSSKKLKTIPSIVSTINNMADQFTHALP